MVEVGIIKFSDGSFHKGGTKFPNPTDKVNYAKTYSTVGRAKAVLKVLQGNTRRYAPLLKDATVIPASLTTELMAEVTV